MRGLTLLVIIGLLALTAGCDQDEVKSGKDRAESAGRKAAETGESLLWGPYGIRFNYPVINDPVTAKQRWQTGQPVDGLGRGLEGWTVIPGQGFDAPNNWFMVCGERYRQTRSADCHHAGVDLWADGSGASDITAGNPVFPITDGTIVDIHDTGSYPGDAILIRHDTDAGSLYSVYAHIDYNRDLREGQSVSTSDWVGTIHDWKGNAHLHLEIRTFGDFTEVLDKSVFACGCPVGPGYWLASRGGPRHPLPDRNDIRWLDPIDIIETSQRLRS